MRDIHGSGALPLPQANLADEADGVDSFSPGGPKGGEPELSARYAADHAALAFGIPRIAPVLAPAAEPPFVDADDVSVARFDRDPTESLTADERQAAAAFSAFEPEMLAPDEPVTAALRVPKRRAAEPRPIWGGTQRLVLTDSPTVRTAALAGPRLLPGPAVLGPGEGATTTVTLPTRPPGGGPRSTGESLARGVLLGSGAALAMGLAVLLGRALPDGPPPSALRTPASEPHSRERLIEQAVAAIREGRREQAVALLVRYQAGETGSKPERAVELMLRTLRKELALAGPGH